MSVHSYPNYPTGHGYMTEQIMRDYIYKAIEHDMLPPEASRMANIISLSAPNDPAKPIQFWQLFSVLGQDRIVRIIQNFYERVFADEDWFTSVFARVGPVNHHINTQASMWLDVMGAGHAYHGAEFRLNFHHTHNAMALMNQKGADRWTKLMLETLDDSAAHMTDDPRVRTSINTFLNHFMGKYAEQFEFTNSSVFGDLNPPVTRLINFRTMTSEAIEALTEAELREAFAGRGVDASAYGSKAELVSKALMM